MELSLQVQTRESPTETSLVEQAIKREASAFAALYERFVNQVYRHVYYRVSNQADAEDITEEVFIKAWKAIHKYRITGAPFAAWLFRIARNLITDHYKARKSFIPLEGIEIPSNPQGGPEALTEAAFEKDYVKKIVLQLKGDKQKVILMRFIDGFTYKEIARILHKSEGAVRVIQYRALSDLREIFSRGGGRHA